MDGACTWFEFQEQYPTEEACWEGLRRWRWPEGFACPRCGGRESYFLRVRRLEQCRTCRRQISVTAGTLFHKTLVPLRVWFLALFFLAHHKKGISALQLQRTAGLGSYKTAWTLLHKIRQALGGRRAARLRGLVEADETLVGGRREPGAHGRWTLRKALVAGAIERQPHDLGSVRLSVIRKASAKHLLPFLRDTVDPNAATICTDGWKGYGTAVRELGGRHRKEVLGSLERASKVLPRIHTAFSNLKNWILGTFHGVSRKHLPRYLEEFSFRFDLRGQPATRFPAAITLLLRNPPFPYAALVAEMEG